MGGEAGERDGTLGRIVKPCKVEERSYIESFVDYIHEVVAPQTNTKAEEPDIVLWQYTQELQDGSIVLLIGYITGLQCWVLPLDGDAYEIFSHRKGPVKTARYLEAEKTRYSCELQKVYPFVLIVDSSHPKPASTCVDIWSLQNSNKIHTIHFKSEIFSLCSNLNVIVVALKEKIAVFDSITFDTKFWVSRCYPCTSYQPICLGSRWLTYAERMGIQTHQSFGGVCGTGLQSYTATVLNAAESVKKGLSIVGETVGRLTQNTYYSDNPSKQAKDTSTKAGVVTIVDCHHAEGETSLSENSSSQATVAHFTAHSESPIAALSFDRSGSLLVTADVVGKDFHVFQINPHPWSSSSCQINHLYVLHRGDTQATVQNLVFSRDARWVCASTTNGTTHVFPVTPYGGPITARTHTCPKLVNKHSRFHTSAGINHISKSNGTIPFQHDNETLTAYQRHSTIPILPTPTVVTPLVQLKQYSPKAAAPNSSAPVSSSSLQMYPIATVFSNPRKASTKTGAARNESLFVLGPGAVLVEYKFDCTVQNEGNYYNDAPIQLTATPLVQWTLGRSNRSEEVLAFSNLSLLDTTNKNKDEEQKSEDETGKGEEEWLSYVEIQSYEQPHRCLWMGPQFCFRTVHVLPSSLNTASSSILADQTVVSEDCHTIDNIYDDMELHSTPLRTDPLTNSEKINGLCVIESGHGSYEGQPSSLEVNMTVDSCYKKDDLLLETITDAMQDVTVRLKHPELDDDDMAISQIIDIDLDTK